MWAVEKTGSLPCLWESRGEGYVPVAAQCPLYNPGCSPGPSKGVRKWVAFRKQKLRRPLPELPKLHFPTPLLLFWSPLPWLSASPNSPTPSSASQGPRSPWSLIRCSSDRWWSDGNPGLSPHKACVFANHILYWPSSRWRWPHSQWWRGNLRIIPSSTGSGDLRILTPPNTKPGLLTSPFWASVLFLTCK